MQKNDTLPCGAPIFGRILLYYCCSFLLGFTGIYFSLIFLAAIFLANPDIIWAILLLRYVSKATFKSLRKNKPINILLFVVDELLSGVGIIAISALFILTSQENSHIIAGITSENRLPILNNFFSFFITPMIAITVVILVAIMLDLKTKFGLTNKLYRSMPIQFILGIIALLASIPTQSWIFLFMGFGLIYCSVFMYALTSPMVSFKNKNPQHELKGSFQEYLDIFKFSN